jgi:hypothetical protein
MISQSLPWLGFVEMIEDFPQSLPWVGFVEMIEDFSQPWWDLWR